MLQDSKLEIPARLLCLPLVVLAACEPVRDEVGRIPVTTSSEEAHELFLEGRDLNDKLRFTDAHEYFVEAVELDPNFAWAHLLAGFTGGTAQGFWDNLELAVAASGEASDGERLLILATEAGAKGKPEEQMSYLTQLVEAYPGDERAHNALGGVHFGRQNYAEAVEHYQRAIEINPEFSQPYNQKGYSHRFLGDYAAAEASFQKYIELIPDDPNPYDSYAELLMKIGRFSESVEKYREALEQDPNFIASYVGIANNQMFMGQMREARDTLKELAFVARTSGERRAAYRWAAQSHLHEGDYDEALASCAKMKELSESDSDLAAVAGDLNLIGDILLEAGRTDEAAESYDRSIETIEAAAVADEVKDNVKRNILFDRARVTLARGDLEGARETAAAYGELVNVKQIAFEVRQHHELLGTLALAAGDFTGAVAHLEKANQQDPRVLFLLAQAHGGLGNTEDARAYARKAADFNGLSGTYAYVRSAAREFLNELTG